MHELTGFVEKNILDAKMNKQANNYVHNVTLYN